MGISQPKHNVERPTVTHRDLEKLSQRKLQELFRTLEAPSPEELNGDYHGTLLTTAGLDRIPSVIRQPLVELLQGRAMPWRGKRFEGRSGVNYWLKDHDGFGLFSYDVSIAPALDGSGDVLQLDYDVERNPAVARRIVGEVRQVSGGLYLARMNYKLPMRPVELLYFTLVRQD